VLLEGLGEPGAGVFGGWVGGLQGGQAVAHIGDEGDLLGNQVGIADRAVGADDEDRVQGGQAFQHGQPGGAADGGDGDGLVLHDVAGDQALALLNVDQLVVEGMAGTQVHEPELTPPLSSSASLGYFADRRDLAADTFRIQRRDVLTGQARRIVALNDGTATIGGGQRHWSTVGVYDVDVEDRIAACWLLALDQRAFDAIWSG
jgi:hypothetical protein